MLDREIQAVLPAFERFVRKFRAPRFVQQRLAYDNDDVHSVCRFAAVGALEVFRAEYPAKAGTVDEIKYVRRCIAHAFLDIIRKANRLSRCMDETAEATIQAGNAEWMPKAGQTLEEDFLDAEREEACRRACEQVRAIIGDDVYEDLIRSITDGRTAGVERKKALHTYDRRRRGLERARRQMTVASLGAVVDVFGGSMTTEAIDSDRFPKDLSSDELSRVGLFYKRQHGSKVESLEKDHLLAKVEAVNTVDGEVYPFPPCFALQFEPKDDACAGVGEGACDFRGDCKAASKLDPDVETDLVQIRARIADKAAAEKEAEKAKVKPPKEPKAAKEPKLTITDVEAAAAKPVAPAPPASTEPTTLALKQVFKDNDKRSEGKRKVVVIELLDNGMRARVFDPLSNTTSTVGAGSFFKTGSKGFSYVGAVDGKAWDEALIGAGMKPAAPVVEPSQPPEKVATATPAPSTKNDKGREKPTVVAKTKPEPVKATIHPHAVEEIDRKKAKADAAAKKKADDAAAKAKAKADAAEAKVKAALEKEAAKKAKADAKAAKAKPAKKAKEKPAKAKKESTVPRGATVLEAPVLLSNRKTLPASKKRVDPRTNKPWVRLPQGSAAELAQLPVGHRIEREFNGFTYGVKKIKDGPVRERDDGTKIKRDGVWILEWKRNDTANVKEEIQGVEGSLGVITRFITKSNVWSAAKFFNVVPDQLNPHKKAYAPTKFKATPIYAHGGVKGPKKSEKKRKPPKKKAKG